jgi:GDP-4-dehydro-6-deoxy-D-mannose reductase
LDLLVTGAAGFLGKAVIRAADPSLDVTTLDKAPLPGRHILCDITDGDSLRKALRGVSFQAVIHLAGLARGTPGELERVNVLGTRNLVSAVPGAFLVNASSCAVYGLPENPDGTVDEAQPPAPVTPYGRSMLARETEVSRGVSMRLFNVTGPGQGPGMLVPDLAGRLARIALGLSEGPLTTGSLASMRDYLDVRDAARAILAAAGARDLPPALNLGSGVARSGYEVLRALQEAMGVAPGILADDRPAGVPVIRAALGRIRRYLEFTPSVPFDESMKAVALDWLRREGQAV